MSENNSAAAEADKGLRARVERLLKGQRSSDDLTRLFLYARDRCDGREPVQEVGDFVAHHHERTKGIATRGTGDRFSIASFVPFFAGIKQLHGSHLPSNFPAFLMITFGRLDVIKLKKDMNLRRAHARQILLSAIKKSIRNADNTLSTSTDHTESEINLIRYVASVLTSKPAFDNDQLFSDFRATLKSHSLLKKEEMKLFESVKPNNKPICRHTHAQLRYKN